MTNNKKRKYALFIHDNKVVSNFNVPIGELPFPTARMLNYLLRRLEDENFFNKLLLQAANPDYPDLAKLRLLRVLLVTGVAGLVCHGLLAAVAPGIGRT